MMISTLPGSPHPQKNHAKATNKTPSTELEKYLKETISRIRGMKRTVQESTPHTQTLISIAVNELNNLSIELKKKEKRE